MTDRVALLEIFKSTTGERWKDDTNWISPLRIGLWYGVSVDESGHIQRLDLTDNSLYGIIPDSKNFSGSMINLQFLYLGSNQLGGSIPRNLGCLESLIEINLSWNLLEGDIPESLYSLKQLRMIRLDNNRLVGQVSQRIMELTNLKYINLSRNQFTGVLPSIGQHHLPELQVIDFTGNLLTGMVPTTIRDWRNIRQI
mmetsp:Transcript_302/g.549  ORF Transcript_302/g.549 Transcript_302/m.549 type:complete len:197 (+) Transcript_302:1116-1706(+)